MGLLFPFVEDEDSANKEDDKERKAKINNKHAMNMHLYFTFLARFMLSYIYTAKITQTISVSLVTLWQGSARVY